MPSIGFAGDYAQKNYINASSSTPYTYYKRKHNPFIIADSVATQSSRVELVRNFNNFAQDVNASALPAWVFISPNLVNDARGSTAGSVGSVRADSSASAQTTPR